MARSSQFEFRFTGVDKGVKKTLNGIEGDLDGFGKKAGRFAVGVAGAFAAAFAVDKLVDFGKTLFTLGNDVAVWELKASTVFGSNADAVRQWADSVNESMGISDERVVGLAAAMGDILVPMGATRSEAAKLSMEMVGLAPKLAIMAGSSYDTAQVAEILSDALRGEKDALSGLGLPLT
ncbi:MAG: hypothetical protein OEM40_07985, partial [Acidimicrobiia bacterium]|nr:hypothetical protein [Acidimicrobiia bacterium]